MLLTAVWIAAVVYIGAQFSNTFHVGFSNCLPSDFPKYPRATLASIVISDSFGDCTMQFQTRDSTTEVQDFYKTHLSEGDWTVTATDDRQGLIQFERISKPGINGYVKVLGFPGQAIQFQVQLRNRYLRART